MPDHLTVDVIDRPQGGALRATRRLRRAGDTPPDGMRQLLVMGTAHFVPRLRPALTPRRIAVVAAWDGQSDAASQHWSSLIEPLAEGAREHWHVRSEIARAAFTAPWNGWTPDTEGTAPLRDDEPALILVSGALRLRSAASFFRDAPSAVAHAFDEPGYLGGTAINTTSGLTPTSCSAWRTYGDAKRYAFADGRHATAMRRDRQLDRHSTEWFLRLRPVAERGTLNGAQPFGELLGERAAPTPA